MQTQEAIQIPETVHPDCHELYREAVAGLRFMESHQPDIAGETAIFEKVVADLESGLTTVEFP